MESSGLKKYKQIWCNPHNIELIGHSAGAHLVTLLSMQSATLDKYTHTSDLIKCIAGIDTNAYDVNQKVDYPEDNQIFVLTHLRKF